jgi:hypothetical protein
MKLVGVISTAVLSLTLGVAAPAFAQEREQQEEQKSRPEMKEDKKAEPAKPAKQEEQKVQQEKTARPEEKTARQEDRNVKPAEKKAEPQQRASASGNRGGRIPDDRFKANFGREHSFHVSQSDYQGHRFQYGGYSFGFVDAWPSNWLYTQDVYVVEIDGVYYLCNPTYPGVNVALSFSL